jgi:carboxynorspermidine decarboxylase
LTQTEINKKYKDLDGPTWVCNLNSVERNMKILENIQKQADVKILIALKGSSLPATFEISRKYLKGCCASGLYEAKLASEFGGEVHTYSPAFKDNEFNEIVELSDHIIFNSLSQYSKYKHRLNGKNAGLRINPEYSTVTTDLYNPCQPFSRFGVTKLELEKALETDPNILDGISLLHFHALCKQNSDALSNVVDVIISKFANLLNKVDEVNMGGGHSLTEHDYDVELLTNTVKKLKEKFPNITQVYMEPGEAILYDTGVLVGEVVDIVTNNMDIAILDISASCHLIDILEMPYRAEIFNGYNPLEEKFTYRLGGPTCLSGDYLGDYSFDNKLEIGDKIVVDDQIHYSFVKTNHFNGMKHPSIAVEKNGAIEVVKSFDYDDFRDRLGKVING